MIITPEFEEALDLIDSEEPFIFITGKAGTGKTTFTNLLKTKLKNFAVVAPTGVAALNVGGQTIHSFFRLMPGPIDFSNIKRLSNRRTYQTLRTLIIDEISMVRADLLDAIDQFLRQNGPRPEKPFGGVQIIAVGDLFQLPPVISSDEEQHFQQIGYSTPFFFSAKCLREAKLKCIEFSQVFRQTEESFIKLLNNVREGRKLGETLSALNERVVALPENEFTGIRLTTTNSTADKINARELTKLPGVATVYRGEVSGDIRVDANKLPAQMELQLKVGARVMFLRNDRERRWVNGSIGTVVKLDSKVVSVELRDDNDVRTVRVEADKWENFKYSYDEDKSAVIANPVGAYTQIPLTLAWAVTIHKSQGKTFDRAHVDLGRGAFAGGQVYVALSRCRTLQGVTLQRPITAEDVSVNFEVINFQDRVDRG